VSAGEDADPGPVKFVVGGALALTAHFFPRRDHAGKTRIRLDDACFLLSGQVGVWSAWPQLGLEDQIRVARLLRFRPVEVANRNVFGRWVHALVPAHIGGFRPDADGQLLVDLGRPPLEYADECIVALLAERELRERRPAAAAGTGEYGTTMYAPAEGRSGTRTVDVRYQLAVAVKTLAEDPIDIGEPAAADVAEVPVAELRDIAVRLDDASGETYRAASVDRMFGQLQSGDGQDAGGRWVLPAGPTRILQAPTGAGKNVVAELLACWCASRGMVTSLVLPTNAAVVKTAHALETSLRILGVAGEAVPLTSPDSAQKVAETVVRGSGAGSLGLWAMDRLAYGCALPSAAVAEEEADTWEPGSEPCTGLRRVGADGRASGSRHACPWRPSCGKYRNARAAASASIVVTSHVNWLVGSLHVPVLAQGRVEESLSIEELLLHRSHLVLIDEIDAFQAAMIGRSARGLLLAHRRRHARASPLRRLDTELSDAPGRVDALVEHDVRAATAQARYLAESYTGHLAEGAFRRDRRSRQRAHPMHGRWLLPRKWDAWLAATLFGLPDGEQPATVHYQALQGLFPGEGDPDRVPEWLRPVRAALARVTSITDGGDAFQPARDSIHAALADAPYPGSRLLDDQLRMEATDRLIRRAYLEHLRGLLLGFVYAAPQLQASGISAAQEIAEALGQYASWRAAPYGPLGRSLFAFTEHHDPDRAHDTTLRVSAFGGDPHTYVTALGGLTAQAHLGRERIVVGFSATAFFPAAPHHHVFTAPAWWVPDDQAGGVRIIASPVSDEEREFLRVSGTYGQARTDIVVRLGELLWKKHLAPALRDLAGAGETAHRQRLLLATTSYRDARSLAEGISNAGVPAGRIIVAVPADETGSGPRQAARWFELPADQLESFGRNVDGAVLIAPLARAQRGLNIADAQGRSLIGSVWLVVRPLPLVDEPAEILAHVHARAHAAVRPSDDPAAVLDIMRQVAGRHFDELFTALPYFRTLPGETQLAIAAEILNGLIQLAGRARRGGAIGEIHLVDYAFIDSRAGSDLPSLVGRLRRQWARDGHLGLIERLYGQTIQEIFRFADSREAR
jgi:hypothetical protein